MREKSYMRQRDLNQDLQKCTRVLHLLATVPKRFSHKVFQNNISKIHGKLIHLLDQIATIFRAIFSEIKRQKNTETIIMYQK